MKKKIYLGLILTLTVVFMAILILVACNYSFATDNFFITQMSKIRTEQFDAFVKVFTYIGWFFTLLLISVGFIVFSKGKEDSFIVLFNLLFSGIVGTIIKFIVRRNRPSSMIIDEIGFSFPSAHAMLTLVVFATIIYLCWKNIKNKKLNIVLTAFFSLLILFVGFTRVYLNVHYFTDVLAGYILGIILTFVSIYLFSKVKIYLEKILKRLH